jgi:hypothetical protein
MFGKRNNIDNLREEEERLQNKLDGTLQSLQNSLNSDSYSLVDELTNLALILQRELRKLREDIEFVSMCD